MHRILVSKNKIHFIKADMLINPWNETFTGGYLYMYLPALSEEYLTEPAVEENEVVLNGTFRKTLYFAIGSADIYFIDVVLGKRNPALNRTYHFVRNQKIYSLGQEHKEAVLAYICGMNPLDDLIRLYEQMKRIPHIKVEYTRSEGNDSSESDFAYLLPQEVKQRGIDEAFRLKTGLDPLSIIHWNENELSRAGCETLEVAEKIVGYEILFSERRVHVCIECIKRIQQVEIQREITLQEATWEGYVCHFGGVFVPACPDPEAYADNDAEEFSPD